jgi:hypothetical protein
MKEGERGSGVLLAAVTLQVVHRIDGNRVAADGVVVAVHLAV